MKPADTGFESRFEVLEPRLLLDGQTPTVEVFGALPALFVENQGQWADSSVRYAFNGSGANVLLTDTGPVLQLFQQEATGEEPVPGLPPESAVVTQTAQVSVAFEGANAVSPVGVNRAETVFNYFVGNQADWRSAVPGYEMVAYQGLYSGIDLYTSAKGRGLKYEFHVAPGIDYRQIQITYAGTQGLSLGTAGELRAQTAAGELVDAAPSIYQEIGGQRVPVFGCFELVDQDTYGFRVTGEYDPGTELVFDPQLAWSTYIGGDSYDTCGGVAVDSEGNAYVTGDTFSAGWVSGRFDNTHNGNRDAFVAKYSSSGRHLWSTYLGGSGDDGGRGIAADGAGGVVVTGFTGSPGWVSGGYDTVYGGGPWDAFAVRLSTEGVHIWSTYLGGSDQDLSYGVAVDGAGAVYVTGYTGSAGWVSGAYDDTYNGGGADAFAARLSLDGSHLWSTYIGAGDVDFSESGAVAVGADGSVYVSGITWSAGWASGGFDTTFNGGGRDGFVVKITQNGAHAWSTYLGGGDDDIANGTALDDAGGIYVVGHTWSPGWVSGGYDTTHGGNYDGFVVRITSEGAHVWSTYLGGSGRDIAMGIAPDGTGGVYVAGNTASTGWISGGFDTSLDGAGDGYVARLTATGAHLWSSYLGGESPEWYWDCCTGIARDCAGVVYVAGRTDAAGWISGGNDVTYNGDVDAFLAKITEYCAPVAVDDTASTDEETAVSVDVLANDQGVGDLSIVAFDTVSAQGARVTMGPDNTLVYDPTASATLQALAAGQVMQDTFTYSITDSRPGTDTPILEDLAPMQVARWMFAGAIDKDGRVYALGGYIGEFGPLTSSVERWDPATGVWSYVAPMLRARQGTYFGAQFGGDGRLYAFGGGAGDLSAAEAYDPSTNTWQAIPDLPQPRTWLASASDRQGRVYAIGGGASLTQPESTVYRYDPALGNWESVAPMNVARSSFSAAADRQGRIYVFGGFTGVADTATVERYDPDTNTWSLLASMSYARVGTAAAWGGDNAMYVFGGWAGTFTDEILRYDIAANSWSSVGRLSVRKDNVAAVTNPDGDVYIFGGEGPGIHQARADMQRFVVPNKPATATVTVTVTGVNYAPVANGDDCVTDGDTSVVINVLANDSDVDGDALVPIVVDGPRHGVLTLNPDGSFTYAPVAGFDGSDAFTYKASDGMADSNVAIVTITVNPVIPPAAPTIDLDAASDSGRSDTDDITRDNTPTFSGAADAGSTVKIYSGTTFLGQTEATAENTWTFMTGALADGVHVITATATNAAGKVSAPSDLLSVAIDTVAPVITISSPADGAVSRLNDIVLAGHAATDGGSGIASCVGTVADGSNVDTASVGDKTFSVTATDVAGNSTSVIHNYEVKYAIGAGETMTANLFLNLANSDDIGTYFDLMVEAVDNHGNVVASGMIDRYRALFVNNNLTNKNMLATSIVLTASSTTFFDEGESFSLRVSMRIDEGTGHSSGRLQLQYDAVIRGSNLVADFGGGDKVYYLHDQGVMNTMDSTGDTTVDLLTKLASKQNGDPWVLLGAWTGQV